MYAKSSQKLEALRSAFLSAMSRVASTVTVVTTSGQSGEFGATVSAMSSVSADGLTPTLLVCLHGDGNVGQEIIRNGSFCVNILSSEQADISDIFAGRYGASQSERFRAADWHPMPNGAPGLPGALARLSCRVSTSHRVGTHDVIFGAVDQIDLPTDGAPLIYACRNYARPAPLEHQPRQTLCA
ncbi:flavin reductase family protein [Aliiroseovarius sp. KMU-50]|uniref:Flavin reductase family protein n=1 Tax=Aliiroseovarius salicola TaxID=3009082 RepID=A0ABT4VZR0_9RHOB|nr:flavin reductase family protein [Aliiroseovarius sp. KMU-50]MDA5093732.1 flavin reductase family protein [Aliiroseovarius sp. KMU-50]